MTKKELALEAINLLKKQYIDATCSLVYNKNKPYELLIATRLSAQCTDARVNIVTPTLFSRYQSLEELSNANISDLENIIRSCGFYHTKAKDIKIMCTQLIEDYNSILPDTIEELTKLSGIGRKTANLIVGDIYGKPSIVTDTHCIRICGRLGLTTGLKEPKAVENALRKLLPPNESGDFCHRTVLLGREFCIARKPKCDICPLNKICKQKI